ncbi:MAG: hypothetical protein IKF64_02675 [Eubacterium sp.]|nr:hypothetical protein [Eubacterium sp.]
MDLLEEFWNGNINPMEFDHLESDSNYRKAVEAYNLNQERLKAVLSEKQQNMLDLLIKSSNELATIIELDCFKIGFKLGARLTIEAYS